MSSPAYQWPVGNPDGKTQAITNCVIVDGSTLRMGSMLQGTATRMMRCLDPAEIIGEAWYLPLTMATFAHIRAWKYRGEEPVATCALQYLTYREGMLTYTFVSKDDSKRPKAKPTFTTRTTMVPYGEGVKTVEGVWSGDMFDLQIILNEAESTDFAVEQAAKHLFMSASPAVIYDLEKIHLRLEELQLNKLEGDTDEPA